MWEDSLILVRVWNSRKETVTRVGEVMLITHLPNVILLEESKVLTIANFSLM